MKHIEAQDLYQFATVLFEGETNHVMQVTSYEDKIILTLSPTNGLDQDRILAFPPKFSFELIEPFKN